MTDTQKQIRHYYVDEAGDLTLFDNKGRITIGNNGVSQVFMIGFVYLTNPQLAQEKLEALAHAIIQAKYNFEQKWCKGYDKPFMIDVKQSSEEIGLQVIDYYLWALQRLYEKNDDSFFNSLAPNYSLIIDLDDKRIRGSGQWYSKKNPLTLAKLKPLAN